jgi:type IV fimbrial biogenesis protein FimT
MIVAMGVFALMIALAAPTMRKWINNTRVRAAADSLQNGIRLAQAESLRRSRQVIFSLTDSTTFQPNFAASGTGHNWSINAVPSMTDGSDTSTLLYIESGVVASSPLVQITGQPSICFNSAGRLVSNATSGVTNTTGVACTAPPTAGAGTAPMFSYNIIMSGADRPLRVNVALGGQTHMCDPSKTLSATNPDGCPP